MNRKRSVYKRGSNQYKKVHNYLRLLGLHTTHGTVYFMLLICLGVFSLSYRANRNWMQSVITPCPDRCDFNPVYAKEPLPTPTPVPPTPDNVVAEITRTFLPHGKGVVAQAIQVSLCESGWRNEAYNYNTNGSSDFNVFQINSVHLKQYGKGFTNNWIENIKVAENIYARQGWTPWVCARKLGII